MSISSFSSASQDISYRGFKYFDYIIALLSAVLIISNIASSAKIVDLGFSIFGIGLAFDGGTLLFPVAYIIGDVLTEVYGFKAARRAIWTGFAVLILAALVFFVLKILPPEAGWNADNIGNEAYDHILSGMSTGGIVIASLLAYLAGEFSNAVVLSRVKVLMQGRLLWLRTIGSSLVGQALDTFIFVSIATLMGVFPPEIFISLLLTNYLLKTFLEAAATPLTYLAVLKLKKAEGIDVYDTGIKYRLFGS